MMQAAQRLGTGPAQTIAAVDQQPQRDRGVVNDDLPQTVGA
jgi:hypothetical protein